MRGKKHERKDKGLSKSEQSESDKKARKKIATDKYDAKYLGKSVQGGTAAAPRKTGAKVDSAERDLAKTLRAQAKEQKKKERFIRSRMWTSLLISRIFQDRGTIPDNIGNNVLITNNMYITKNNLTAIIHIREMSETTPISWTSDLVKYVKDTNSGVTVDITMKGQRYYPDITPGNIGSRERTWHQTLDNPFMPEIYVRRAARCLYTLDIVRSGAKTYKCRVYIQIRAKDGATLRGGVNSALVYLASIGCQAKRIQSNIEEHLDYMTLMSDKKPTTLKDIAPVIFSTQTFAESMPVVQGANDTKGVLLGYDIISGYPYFVDFKATAAAKNIMIEALSGWGKSFMASYWLYPFYAQGFNLAIMDIKGNEFNAITEALHGVHLSMRPTSTNYINTFRWRTDEVFDGDTTTYAHERFRMSKERMLIICDLNEKETSQAEALLEEFLQYTYVSIGAQANNVNTWHRTDKLTPYVIFDLFERYISNEIRAKYSQVVTKMLERLRIYMSRKGSKSHIYRNQYSYLEVLDTNCLTFDFGILESSSADNDPVTFKLHVLDMITINDEYVSYKKKKGEWTVKLLEESQIVDDWLTKVYTREMTLRRAQNQCTILLGNSVAALAANPLSKPIIENINILCLGSLNKSSRDFLRDEFGLKDSEQFILNDIQTNPDMQRRFLLINRMEQNATTAILEANVTNEVANSSLFKFVDTVD